ncbi:Photosystem I chlorophyll a apoprotein A1 [Capsicum chinense]|nr:Photosystem I chlorophyll a apoprotein A1 [Capsicum chinense]
MKWRGGEVRVAIVGATPFFTLNWSKYADFLTFRGGLDPVTGGLWLTDIAHHHLAIAILFLIAGHIYKTNWGIGHGLKDILEAHKGPFTEEEEEEEGSSNFETSDQLPLTDRRNIDGDDSIVEESEPPPLPPSPPSEGEKLPPPSSPTLQSKG